MLTLKRVLSFGSVTFTLYLQPQQRWKSSSQCNQQISDFHKRGNIVLRFKCVVIWGSGSLIKYLEISLSTLKIFALYQMMKMAYVSNVPCSAGSTIRTRVSEDLPLTYHRSCDVFFVSLISGRKWDRCKYKDCSQALHCFIQLAAYTLHSYNLFTLLL